MLYRFEEGGASGYIDATGRIVVKAKHKAGGTFVSTRSTARRAVCGTPSMW
jgi:hypothetical protein